MKKYLARILAGLILAGIIPAGYALSQGASNIISTVTGSMLVPIDSGTLASDTTVDAIKTYINGSSGNTTITGTLTTTGFATFGTVGTCTGTTTATCQGQRFVVSITGLTTAAGGTTSAAMVVTNASVASASSLVICQPNGYSGTGVPVVTTVTPGTGSVSLTITNVADSGSLNATVPVACFVLGA